MSDPTRSTAGHSQVKTLAVRITEDVRAQLDIIAQLNDRTVTDEIRLAIEAWIEKTKADPTVLARAESVRADIERDATLRRHAIESIFNTNTGAGSRPTAGARRQPRDGE